MGDHVKLYESSALLIRIFTIRIIISHLLLQNIILSDLHVGANLIVAFVMILNLVNITIISCI